MEIWKIVGLHEFSVVFFAKITIILEIVFTHLLKDLQLRKENQLMDIFIDSESQLSYPMKVREEIGA